MKEGRGNQFAVPPIYAARAAKLAVFGPAGRSSYLNADQLVGHNDPGAEAVAILFEHLARL